MTTNAQTLGVLRDDLTEVYRSAPRTTTFLARILFPEKTVRRRRGDYLRIPRAAYMQKHNTKRARGAGTSQSSFAFDEDNFSLVEYGHMAFVPRGDQQDLEGFIDAQEEATVYCRRVVDVDTEYDVASELINETNYPASGSTGVTLSNTWDSSNGTPVDDIAAGHVKFAELHGVMANTLVVPWEGWVKGLSRNAQVRGAMTENFGPVKPGLVPASRLQEILNVQNILVAAPDLVYNSANPNQAPSYTPIWNRDYAFLTRIATGDFTDGPYLGRLLVLADGGSLRITSAAQFDPEGTWVRAEYDQEIKRMPDAPGYLIKNILS